VACGSRRLGSEATAFARASASRNQHGKAGTRLSSSIQYRSGSEAGAAGQQQQDQGLAASVRRSAAQAATGSAATSAGRSGREQHEKTDSPEPAG